MPQERLRKKWKTIFDMPLKVPSPEGMIELTEFSIDDSENTICAKSESEEAILKVNLNFDIDNIDESHKKWEGESERILIFRNDFFSQSEIIQIRAKERPNGSGVIGYLFKISALLLPEETFVTEKAKIFALRAIMRLVMNEASIKAQVPTFNSSGEYYLEDFFDLNLIIGNFYKDFLNAISDLDFHKDYLIPFLTHGFYLIPKANTKFHINHSDYISLNLASLPYLSDEPIKIFKIIRIPETVRNEPYIEKYSSSLVCKSSDLTIRFHTLYQIVEIFIDNVLKDEITESICGNINSITGTKLKDKISEIANQGYRVKKLFSSKYATFDENLKDDIILNLNYFLTEEITGFESISGSGFNMGTLIYKLRNNIVHNYKFIFEGDEEVIQLRKDKLIAIIDYFEFVLWNLLISYKK